MLPAGYMIMSDGRIKGPSGRWIKGTRHPAGYRWTDIVIKGRRRKFYLHELVCTAFHGPRPTPKHQVRHLDGDPANNAAWNLCWGTVKENAEDRVRHGTSTPGEKQWLAKLTWEGSREIRSRYAAGGISMAVLAAEYGVKRETIRALIQGRTWHDPDYVPPRRINLEDARAIRARYRAGGVLQRELAEEYGVSQVAISLIITGKSWADPSSGDRVDTPYTEETS
jgi:plasmid maintenance system antidote protein VapI